NQLGQVTNVKTSRILKQNCNRVKLDNGLKLESFRVKNLMYELFVQNGAKLLLGEVIKHRDGNDNNFDLDNLVKTSRAGLRRTVGEPVLDPSKKWIAVRDYPDYLVSDCGDVFSKKTNAFLSRHCGDSRYYRVVVCDENKKFNKLVHVLVFYSFNPKIVRTKEFQIDHIDRDSKNNKLSNLRLATISENNKNKDFKAKIVKITQLDKKGKIIKVWDDITDVESQLGYPRKNIFTCCNGKVKTAYGFVWKKDVKKRAIDISMYKPITAYKGKNYPNYGINEHGEVVNFITKYVIKPQLPDGYLCVGLSCSDKTNKSCYVHKLVACTFLKNKNNYTVVNHIDKNKLNNHVSNLEWCTPRENTTHAMGKKVIQIDPETSKVLNRFDSISEAARHIKGNKCSSSPISNACSGKTKLSYGYKWKWAE
ncbi:hypothetical protein EON73_03750, partial [bacterium]